MLETNDTFLETDSDSDMPINQEVPNTITLSDQQNVNSVDETIDRVIAEALNFVSQPDEVGDVTWGEVTGNNSKHFPFTVG